MAYFPLEDDIKGKCKYPAQPLPRAVWDRSKNNLT